MEVKSRNSLTFGDNLLTKSSWCGGALFEVNCPLIEWRSDITLCRRVWQFSEKYSYNPNATTTAGDTNIAAFQVFSRRFFQILKGPSLPQKERTRVILLAELPFFSRGETLYFCKVHWKSSLQSTSRASFMSVQVRTT